jgi:sec-independent protein translocase protein TatA
MLEGPDLIIVLVVVLVLFGGAQLPKLARGLGEAQREFRKGMSDVGHGPDPKRDSEPPVPQAEAPPAEPAQPQLKAPPVPPVPAAQPPLNGAQAPANGAQPPVNGQHSSPAGTGTPPAAAPPLQPPSRGTETTEPDLPTL